MIRACDPADFEAILGVVNDGAQAYRGVIPAACWHEPYMPESELRGELAAGVAFWAQVEGDQLRGVMGIQDVHDVTLIRHAYVLSDHQRRGIGSQLLQHLLNRTARPVLLGTWADAVWAARFYEKHGFRKVAPEQKDRLLSRYWSVPGRQVAASVVLVDPVARRELDLG